MSPPYEMMYFETDKIFPALTSALWPFSENIDAENDYSAGQELKMLTNEEEMDPSLTSSDDSDYFNQCLDTYRCDICYKVKQEGKCAKYTNECRKTCTQCKGPDSDRYGTVRCQFYKNKGYCDYLSFKSFKCQKTCGTCAVDGNWGEWSKWTTCSKSCKHGNQSRNRKCNSPAPRYGGMKCEGDSSATKICNQDVPCPVDGSWGEWSQWSVCSKSCKQGKHSRTRKCNSPAPQYGGKKCKGDSSETEDCNKNVPCPVDGNWGEWSKWTACSKTCKQGKQTRNRKCNSPLPQYGGKKCVGDSSDMQICNNHIPCPVDGNWGQWSPWSSCSKSCRQGKYSRERKCDSPAPQHGGKKCEGKATEEGVCNKDIPCPVDGNWGEWSKWSQCSKTCQQGNQTRKRVCDSPAPNYGGKKCPGYSTETQICNRDVPCPVDGNWGKWSKWSECSKTCKQGKQSRERECNYPSPKYGGKKCQGHSSQERVCNENVPCPVEGNWGDWSRWSTCTKTCKQGKQSRKRECNSPVPKYGGKTCPGDSSESQDCKKDVPCPIDGNWGDWSEWSTCSKTCKQGKQSRQRLCNYPAPKYGGRKCEGQSSQEQICNGNVSCPVDGNWGVWSKWSQCSKTCKHGTQTRKRECDSPAPKYGGKKCPGYSSGTQVCNKDVPCPVDGNWGPWGKWSECSSTCGPGKQTRVRQCNNPAPAYGGKKCEGPFKQNGVCIKRKCPVDGKWGKWSSWSECSKSCKQGQRSRSRKCDSPVPKYDGNPCDGDSKQKIPCNENIPCPDGNDFVSSVDGMWGSWTTWSACSQTCGYGIRDRKRYCDSPRPAYNGSSCVGDGYQKMRCHAYYPCPVNGNWTSWSSWTPCTKTCGLSYRKRSRSCTNPRPQYGGNGCDGTNEEVGRCTRQACDIYG
ncbi:A disintegrin and metalloproteinase with thrombospondin motifs adt-1-like [Montipora foliosa]|uniref:A disintegrin and metalloproteinase with thrombospondin motifs adt-1-like n=1 Tax=Montipora foliosa TaxID=591990 RepID=UPI0035F1B218